MEKLAQQHVLVLGLGRTGLAAAAYCYDLGKTVYAWDDDAGRRAEADAFTQAHPDTLPIDADWLIMKSPGMPESLPLVQKLMATEATFISDIDLLYLRNPKATYIGITGTNGKSTTTALVGHVLEQAGKKVAVGGNIGRAALTLPDLGDEGIYVLETSSYQLLSTAHIRFNRACIINLTPDHLDRHGDMMGYLSAKTRIFNRQQQGDTSVLGVDEKELEVMAVVLGMDLTTLRRVSLTGKPADIRVTPSGLLQQEKDRTWNTVMDVTNAKALPGKHNAQNIAMAWGLLAGLVDMKTFAEAVKSFGGLPHRMKCVHEQNDVRFIDDSKATNADAAIKALDSFSNIYWIAGGQPKSDGLGDCPQHLKQVRAVYLIGDAAAAFAEELADKLPVHVCQTMDVAVKAAWQDAQLSAEKPAHVVLSPACASWDQFTDFEHRGRVFAECAKAATAEAGV